MSDTVEKTDQTRELESLRIQLDQATSELQDFLYIVSHDFRGPLRAIMSASMILLEDYAPSLDREAQAELKRQSDAAKRLNKLLEELLKLSRLNRQDLNRQPVDLGALAQRVADSSGLPESALVLKGDLLANVDRTLYELLIEDLIGNSVKFVSAETTPQLEFGRDDEGFYLTDNGIGIDPERASRIFLPFERLNGDDFPGMGMGLATGKRIVVRHGGTIWTVPSEGGGTTIRFTVGD